MSTYWSSLFASLFTPRTEEEALKRENARFDIVTWSNSLIKKHNFCYCFFFKLALNFLRFLRTVLKKSNVFINKELKNNINV